MRFFIFIFIAITAISCTSPNYDLNTVSNKCTDSSIKEIESKFGLKASSMGGSFRNGIRELSLGFRISKNLSIDETRKLIMQCADIYLRNINSDLTIRPLLIEFPFPPQRIDISLFFVDDKGSPVYKPGRLSDCYMYNGKIEYKSVLKECRGIPNSHEVKTIHQESYTEAKKIVEEGN